MQPLGGLKMIKVSRVLSASLLLVLALGLTTSIALGQRSGRSSGRSSSSSSTSSAPKTVHVKGYTRSDGRYVPGYDRAAPGTSTTTGSDYSYGGTSTSTVQRDE